MNKWWLVAFALPAVAGLLWIATAGDTNGKMPARSIPSAPSSEVAAASATAKPQSASVPGKTEASAFAVLPPPSNSVLPAEPMPMSITKLRELLDNDPQAALEVARTDLARDPNGKDAAERNWVVVKALAATGHFEDARREAQVMVPKFRGTHWADDVERHVLAHP